MSKYLICFNTTAKWRANGISDPRLLIYRFWVHLGPSGNLSAKETLSMTPSRLGWPIPNAGLRKKDTFPNKKNPCDLGKVLWTRLWIAKKSLRRAWRHNARKSDDSPAKARGIGRGRQAFFVYRIVMIGRQKKTSNMTQLWQKAFHLLILILQCWKANLQHQTGSEEYL